MRLKCSQHGTTISLRKVISQYLFLMPPFSKPHNDPSSRLPQSSSLFIVTGNYTMERLHHFIGSVYNWQEDAVRMFWELHPHLANNLLWFLLFFSKNRTALANFVPKLGTKQLRAIVDENRNHHRGKHGNPVMTPSSFIHGRKHRRRLSFCQKKTLKIARSAPKGWHKKWVSEKPTTQHRQCGSQQTLGSRVKTDWTQIPVSFSTDCCLSLSGLCNLSQPQFLIYKMVTWPPSTQPFRKLQMGWYTESLTHKWCSVCISFQLVLSPQLSAHYLWPQIPSEMAMVSQGHLSTPLRYSKVKGQSHILSLRALFSAFSIFSEH